MSLHSLMRRAPPLAIAMAIAVASAPLAAAQDAGDHDTPRNPELFLTLEQADRCEVSVTVRHVPVEEATLVFLEQPQGDGSRAVLLEREVEGTPEADGNGFRFDEGPFTFPDREPQDVSFRFVVDGEERELAEAFSYRRCEPFIQMAIHASEESGPIIDALEGCTFFVEARNVPFQSGVLRVEPAGILGAEPVLTAPVEGEPQDDGNGFRFFAGPFEVDRSGSYFAVIESAERQSSGLEFFDVRGCTPEGVAPDCPGDLELEVGNDLIFVNFDRVLGADSFRIYRATGDGPLELLAETESDRYVDRDVEPGQTYTYRVTAVGEQGESEGCPTLSATAIPFFGAPLLTALALAGGTGAFVALRQRQRRRS